MSCGILSSTRILWRIFIKKAQTLGRILKLLYNYLMQTLESPPSNIDPKIHELLDGPPSSDYNRRQIQLAVERYVTEHPEAPLNHDAMNEIMFAWTDSSVPENDSRKFKKIKESPEFKTHPKFQGNVANITLEDMEKPLEELLGVK